MFRRCAFLILLLCAPLDGMAFNEDEHRLLAKRALTQVLDECASRAPQADPAAFATRSHSSARNDRARARFHERGRTVLDQLRTVSAADLRDAVAGAQPKPRNVVAGYLLHHARALHKAAAGDAGGALDAEAAALGFLVDAFSSGHLLVPAHLRFSGIQRANIRAAHDYYRSHGVYVINANGRVWQTFGDGLLEWYAPTYRHVYEACVTSLREVLLVYMVRAGDPLPGGEFGEWAKQLRGDKTPDKLVADWLKPRDGGDYLTVLRLPSLLEIPTPVSAAWSVRTDEKDALGMARRHHYPQLLEPGFHDPDTDGIDTRFLNARSSVPEFMVFDRLESTPPGELIRSHPDVASVRYVQERSFPPGYDGFLLYAGGGALVKDDGGGGVYGFGAGYAVAFSVPLFRKVQWSLSGDYFPRFGVEGRSVVAAKWAFGVGTPIEVPLVDAIHLDVGYAWDVGDDFTERGVKWGVGFGTPAVPLRFTYAGISFSAVYERYWLENALDVFRVEMVLQ